jgi:microcystin-dependent protein
MIATGQTIVASDFNDLVPVGAVFPFAGASAPIGYLICDGSAVSRTTYAALFTAIGTTYGAGDGSTTFNLPDMRSSMPLGVGQKTRALNFNGASAVDPSTDQITVPANDWLHTGQPVALTGSSLPTGLTAQTYYVIRISATLIKLATSVNNANNGVAVDITVDGSGTCTLTQVLTSRNLGGEGGTETQTTVPAHAHPTDAEKRLSSSGAGGSGTVSKTGATIDPNGSDTPNNMPPYVVFNFIIRHLTYS